MLRRGISGMVRDTGGLRVRGLLVPSTARENIHHVTHYLPAALLTSSFSHLVTAGSKVHQK